MLETGSRRAEEVRRVYHGASTLPLAPAGRRLFCGRRPMAAKAYVLVKTRVGETPSVQASLAGNPNIRSADVIIGPYDIIALVEADDLNAIGSVVMRFAARPALRSTTAPAPDRMRCVER